MKKINLISLKSFAFRAYIIACILVLTSSLVQAAPLEVNANQPDMCRLQLYSNGHQIEWYMSSYGTGVYIYAAEEVLNDIETSNTAVVVLVNGNGIAKASYEKLALHLANNGYFVIQIQRRNNTASDASLEQSEDILTVLDGVFSMYQLNNTSPISFIGHSVGGGTVMELVKLNQIRNHVYDIRALITLAPKADAMIERNDSITSFESPAYFSIYGSMDQDVKGLNDSYDAFSAYDYIGNEQSTHDGNNSEGEVFKNMLYVHGADHKGLIGHPLADTPISDDLEFIITEDQFCITKAYVTSFLNWQMKNQTNFKVFFTPPYAIPHSVSLMTTSAPDHMDVVAQANPAGSPLRMFFQSSPKVRSVIQSFDHDLPNEINSYEMDGELFMTNSVYGFILDHTFFKENPHFIRNFTNKLMLRWNYDDQVIDHQHLGLQVPASNRDASDFTHLSLRIGQVHNEELLENGGLFINPAGEYQHLKLVLQDADGKEVFVNIDDWGDIPFNDVRGSDMQNNIWSHTALNTISIPLWVFSRRLDISNIKYIGLVFNKGSTGTIIVDSFEWVVY